MFRLLQVFVAVALIGFRPPLGAQDKTAAKAPSAAEALFFEKEVLPILKANCFKCHTGKKLRGGLSLAGRAGV